MPNPTKLWLALLGLLCLMPSWCFAQMSVRESDARIKFTASAMEVTLPLDTRAIGAQQISVSLKLVDPEEKARASSLADVRVQAGQRELVLSIEQPFAKLKPFELNNLIWYRIAYEFRSRSGDLLASGLIPMSARESDLFRLTVAGVRSGASGRTYRVKVNAAQPETLRPASGVVLKGELQFGDEDDQKSTAQAVTNSQGNADLVFAIPADLRRADLTVTGARGILVRSVSQEVRFPSFARILVDTDKPIYQPGQTLHLRSLMFDDHNKAAAAKKLEVRVTDEENTLVLTETIASDSFGVAHADWQIPSNLRLGRYRLNVRETDADGDVGVSGDQSVRIYRYDLPNFSVSAKPDHGYYLAGQNAEVAVTAEYVFGKPVKRGRVRVVEEKERTWDFREQKWKTEEGQAISGDLDQAGRFTAKVDLKEEHESIADERYQRFLDMRMAAYVTDMTTGRTEQRRFTIRVTRDPIHVYLSRDYRGSTSEMSSYFASAFYADGSPAKCTLRVTAAANMDDPKNRHFLFTGTTNKYGLVRLPDIVVAAETDHDRGTLLVEALDSKGLRGRTDEGLRSPDSSTIGVRTSHSIYRPGDPIEVSIDADKSLRRVIVDAGHEDRLIASRVVSLRNGHGFVVFPPDPQFTGPVTIRAYSLGSVESRYSYPSGRKAVLFPKDRRLNTQARFARSVYRPGEGATALLSVRDAQGVGTEAELGVKIVDRAVEERSRTDREFGDSRYGSWAWPLNDQDSYAGISIDDLNAIDLSQPVPQDLDLVAEYLLTDAGFAVDVVTDETHDNAATAFAKVLDRQFTALQNALNLAAMQGTSPHNLDQLQKLGATVGINVRELKDPWNTPYRFTFKYDSANEEISVTSAGPDKKFDTGDDFEARSLQWQYFRHYGQLVNSAFSSVFQSEGRLFNNRDSLRQEILTQSKEDMDLWRDPWGHPYQYEFKVEWSNFVISVNSGGPKWDGSGPMDTRNVISVWRVWQDYFTVARKQIELSVSAYVNKTGLFPTSEEEITKVLSGTPADLEKLRDPWGNKYYPIFKSLGSYADRVVIQQGGHSSDHSTTPVTLERREVVLMSAGPDGKAGTADDFVVATYSAFVAWKSADQEQQSRPGAVSTGDNGTITGVVLDPAGAVIAGAKVTAYNGSTGKLYDATSNSEGRFTIADLPPGTYSVQALARGFVTARVLSVEVTSKALVEIDIILSVGGTNEVVEVTAAAPRVQTALLEVSAGKQSMGSPKNELQNQSTVMSTPRLREYFPETLLWSPSIVTDRNGRAKLDFKLADNITTWKLSALSSTRNGELGTAEIDLRSFQPFFVEHDPPRILTEGDVIAYPVVLRNYLDKPQNVAVSIKRETWFSLQGPAEQRITIDAGDAGRAVFPYRAVASVEGGRQRVTAANAATSDAAEKPLDVHPFGQPTSATDMQLLEKSASLEVTIPDQVISGSLRGRLTIYPNLMSHVIENVEAVLEQPHGCAEQTISSTYPSLLVAQYYKNAGERAPPVAEKARRYVQAGYTRLLGYQESNGGFSYWGHGDPDLALTAYAVNFLSGASQLIDVDDSVVERAKRWLGQQQLADGSWRNSWQKDDGDAVMETAYIARTLAETGLSKSSDSLVKAMKFLNAHHDLLQEPYAIASYTLALMAMGDQSAAKDELNQLRNSAHAEGNASYWALERNSPFYSWGRTGRLESTALAVRALARSDAGPDVVRRGLLFLLHNKNSDGTWYSGQTTVNVLQTLIAFLPADKPSNGGAIHVVVNGQRASDVVLPPSKQTAGPLQLDLAKYLKPGANKVELEPPDGASPISAQFTSDYYVPWPAGASTTEGTQRDGNSGLRLNVSYSRTTGASDDTVECRVKAERIGFRSYGMMLGEIGLPPGADVDRESLENAVKDSWSIDQYDVLPDRVIVYLWPRAGGSEFAFKFRLRFALDAHTAPSELYDYYNPEVSVTLKPVRFQPATSTAAAATTGTPQR